MRNSWNFTFLIWQVLQPDDILIMRFVSTGRGHILCPYNSHSLCNTYYYIGKKYVLYGSWYIRATYIILQNSVKDFTSYHTFLIGSLVKWLNFEHSFKKYFFLIHFCKIVYFLNLKLRLYNLSYKSTT